MSRRAPLRRVLRRAAAAVGAAVGALLVAAVIGLNACVGPLVVEPLRDATAPPVVDSRLAVARRYAPIVLHEFHPTRGRQDVPAPVDFDGNLRGADNWEHMPRFELVPTVYYAVLETETHLFLAYHLFHPRDWATLDLGLHLTHEGDGENLQVVVDKASGRVVLLFTQAHYRGGVYANPAAGVAAGERAVRGPHLVLDERGVPTPEGTHAAVFVECGGHGIYGVPDRRARVAVGADGTARFERAGWVLRPAAPGEAVREPPLVSGAVVPYRLESTTARLWPALASGALVGEGALLDGGVPYADERVAIAVPRYYEGDRFSGPFGPDRGIAPFALDFGFSAPELGSLFFDPARRYAETLAVPEPWSRAYVDYPFGTR